MGRVRLEAGPCPSLRFLAWVSVSLRLLNGTECAPWKQGLAKAEVALKEREEESRLTAGPDPEGDSLQALVLSLSRPERKLRLPGWSGWQGAGRTVMGRLGRLPLQVAPLGRRGPSFPG